MKNFDIVMSNPPYNGNLDIKILSNVINQSRKLLIVHPSTWVMDKKYNSNLFNTFRESVNNKIRYINMFNGNPVFDIQLCVPTMISYIDMEYNGEIRVNFFNRDIVINDIHNVSMFGEHWEPIVKPFANTITSWIENNKSVWSQRKEVPDKYTKRNKVYCQLANIRGTPYRGNDPMCMHTDDFYTLITKDDGVNEDTRNDTILNTYWFDTEKEMKNFISYCKTNFARFCIAIYKTSINIHRGELKYLPWLDFTEEWTDKRLYEYFSIDTETQRYINEFLPNFYNNVKRT